MAVATIVRTALFALAIVVAGPVGSAAAECRDSASRAFSVDIRHSPLSGRACFHTVTVFEGASCSAGSERWAVTLHCGETRRMVVTDRGRLVSLLAPRASRPGWEIVRVFEKGERHVVVRSIRFGELPIQPPPPRGPRLRIDARRLAVDTDAGATVAIDALEALGRVTGRRRLLSR